MKFMEDIEEEISSQFERSSQRMKKHQQSELDEVLKKPSESKADYIKAEPAIKSTALVKVDDNEIFKKGNNMNPREAYQKVRERMLELEIERDEQAKAMQMLQEVRNREREGFKEQLTTAKQQGFEYAEEVKHEMESRMEKQVNMLESLLEDKKTM